MFINDYAPEDYNANYFDVADGIHDMKVTGAEIVSARNGKQMIKVTYVVKECKNIPYVDNYVEGEYFCKNMTRFFDAFSIPRGNFSFNVWINKYGKGCFTHRQETYTAKDGSTKTINKCVLSYLVVPEQNEAPQQAAAPQQNYQQQFFNQPQNNWQN